MKPARSSTKARRPYRKSGYHATKAALSKRGLSALDGRSALARTVRDWRADVASDLGGEETLSRAQRTLLDLASQDVVLVSLADAWMRENSNALINRKRRAFAPLVEQQLKVATHLRGLLVDLGLRRVPKELPTLGEVFGAPVKGAAA